MRAWTIVRRADARNVPLEHHMFGMMLGKDGKPLNPRRRTVKLADLLDGAGARPSPGGQKNPDMVG